MKKSAILLTAMPFFLAAAAMMEPGCSPRIKETPEPIFNEGTKEQRMGRIKTSLAVVEAFNDGDPEHWKYVCPALAAAAEEIMRYGHNPVTEFGITWPGIKQIQDENHCP